MSTKYRKEGALIHHRNNVKFMAKKGKWHSRLGAIGYDKYGRPIMAMVNRGRRYPYDSIRQSTRNIRKALKAA